jgi:hypothetical protein
LTTIFKTNPLQLILNTAKRKNLPAVKANNPKLKIELLAMNKNLKEKPQKCWSAFSSGLTSW